MIKLEISNYSKPFDRLNGNTTQNIRPLDLARAIVTVGQGSWSNVFELGIYRITELVCKALAFSKIENANLVLQDRFYNLNQSEKITISYYFGQGLTKLYAEKHFKIKWLFHVDDHSNAIQFNTKGKAQSKLTIGKSTKNAQRPDLIGIKTAKESHIYEAKGNSGGYDVTVMQHAINQVSQVKTYNGVVPLTRTACYFDLSGEPIKGIIIDPDEDENGIDITFNEELAISNYYSFFKENNQMFNYPIKIGEYEFLTLPVCFPNIFFGFDKRILSMGPAELLSKGLYNEESLFPSYEKSSDIIRLSLGLDGLFLCVINWPFIYKGQPAPPFSF